MTVVDIIAFGRAAEGAAAVTAILFSSVVTPVVFRHVPPDPAGRAFARLARVFVRVALALAVIAALSRIRDHYIGRAATFWPAALDGVASLLFGITLAVIPQFERARDAALREPGMGSGVDGGATLQSHRLLSGIRAMAFVAAVLLILSNQSFVWLR
ncbi:MAG: DUF4149 domain-containing protein [Planctomycetota bacterium]